jgi:peroxiredoxin
MKLKEGFNAQDFTAQDIYGNEIKLSDYKGQKIILSFYRNVSCPFCNRRVHEIMGRRLWLQDSGTQVIFIFESSSQKLGESFFHRGIAPFPLIGDPTKEIYKKYGVENSLLGVLKTSFVSSFAKATQETKSLNLPIDKEATVTLMPADFFINEQFKIAKAHYGTHLDDHIPMEEFSAFAGISV